MKLPLKPTLLRLGLLVPAVAVLLLIPLRYDATSAKIVTSDACGRVGCVETPAMECWARPGSTEPIRPACDLRDCPSSWPPRQQ